MAKVRLSFDFDLAKINPDADSTDVEAQAIATVEKMLLEPARKIAIQKNIEIRKSDLPHAEKQRLMAETLRLTMLTLSAQANMTAETLDEDAEIDTRHPIELAA